MRSGPECASGQKLNSNANGMSMVIEMNCEADNSARVDPIWLYEVRDNRNFALCASDRFESLSGCTTGTRQLRSHLLGQRCRRLCSSNKKQKPHQRRSRAEVNSILRAGKPTRSAPRPQYYVLLCAMAPDTLRQGTHPFPVAYMTAHAG